MKYLYLYTSSSTPEDVPLKEYPRPQMVRESYHTLNGKWNFAYSKKESLPKNFPYEIMVPYPVESSLSLIHQKFKKKTRFYYQKFFSLTDDFIKDVTLLHLDGVDQYCEIYLNGKFVCLDQHGFIPSTIDISAFIQKENELIIKVYDDLDHNIPYGKQKYHSGGIWYTPISGIWKSVWLESVSKNYVKNITLTPSLHSIKIKLDTIGINKEIIINTSEGTIKKSFQANEIEIEIPHPINWTIENPYLYYFTLKCDDDEIRSYFALREISLKNINNHQYVFLNNQPLFLHGVLDQGYFPDGIYTPYSYHEYQKDILKMKSLGFNTLRKHIKIEPLYFYYLCDKLGMLVIQDMVNNGNYNFFINTVLPIGLNIIKLPEFFLHKSKQARVNFLDKMMDSVSLLYNSPSIIMWTLFNEGWGQKEVLKNYQVMASIDQTRLIDVTSGFFLNSCSEIHSLHIYFKKIKIKENPKPIFLSEFGGYVYKIKEHSYNQEKTFGYKFFKSQESFEIGVENLYKEQIIPQIDQGLIGSIYTQLSDVENETNGLLTYDRKICKVDQAKMLEIASLLKIKEQ
jgi:beta-galactosidase/beta-glucuronidase